MFKGKITITGVKELDQKLAMIAADNGTKSVNDRMRKTLRAAVKTIVEPEVRAATPVAKAAYSRPASTRVEGRDEGTIVGTKGSVQAEPGFLLSKITVRATPRSKFYVGYWVGFPDPLYQGDTYYGGFPEFGTKQRQNKKGANRGAVKADSYLRVPLYSNAARVVEFCRQAMTQYVSEMNRAA